MQNDTTNAAAIDARCAELAQQAANGCFHAHEYRTRFDFYTPEHREWLARQAECDVPALANRIIALRTQQAEAPTGRWQVCYRALPFGDCFRQTYWFFVDGTKVDAEREFERMNATARAYELRWIIEAEAATLAQGVQS